MGCSKEPDLSDLQATDQVDADQQQANQAHAGDPVNAVTGSFTLLEPDITLPTQRLTLVVHRYYNSTKHMEQKRPSPFGFGWNHSFNLTLHIDEESVIYIDDRWTKIRFVLDKKSGVACPPKGSLGLSLVKDSEIWSLRQSDGLVANFDSNGRLIALIQPGPNADCKIVFSYDSMGRLIKAEGRGRWLEYKYGGAQPCITRVRTHSGRIWNYRYDRDDQLISVLDPAGRNRQYAYKKTRVSLFKPDKRDAAQKPEIINKEIRALHCVYPYFKKGKPRPKPEVMLQYTSTGRVASQVDALGGITRFGYNRFTMITCVADPLGRTTVYGYDRAGNTTKIRSPGGSTTEYIFDDRQNFVGQIDPLGHQTLYAQLADPDLLKQQIDFGRRSLGNRSDYLKITSTDLVTGYDEKGNRPLMQDPTGRIWSYNNYTMFGKPQSILLPDNEEIRWSYCDRSGLPLMREQWLRRGRQTPALWKHTWKYDKWGNPIREEEWLEGAIGSENCKRILERQYDADGHHPVRIKTWIEDAEGNDPLIAEKELDWNVSGLNTERRVLRRKQPRGETEVLRHLYGYDTLGRKIWELTPNCTATCKILDISGRVIESFLIENASPKQLSPLPTEKRRLRELWRYDPAGHIIEYQDTAGVTTRWQWDTGGQCICEILPSGLKTAFEYDLDGRLVRRIISTGKEVYAEYDLAGRIVRTIDSEQVQHTWTHDALGREMTHQFKANKMASSSSYVYDINGQVCKINRPDHIEERFLYDERGLMIRHQIGDIYVEERRYDALCRMIELSAGSPDAMCPQLLIHYNAAGSVKRRDALGNVTISEMDSAGLQRRLIDPDGRKLHEEYDLSGNLTSRIAPQSKDVSQHFKYDFAGRMIQAREDGLIEEWEYDEAGRLITHFQTVDQITHSLSYLWDGAGRISKVNIDEKRYLKYDYVPKTYFAKALHLPSVTVNFMTDNMGRILEEQWSTGERTQFQFYPFGGIRYARYRDNKGEMVFEQILERDELGRPVRDIRRGALEEITLLYAFDDLGRLAGFRRKKGELQEVVCEFKYDLMGNRTFDMHKGHPRLQWKYDKANRLVEQIGADNTSISYRFDGAGNLIERGDISFEYDSANRLRHVCQQGDAPLTYRWLPTGLLADSNGNGGRCRHVYSGLQRILHTDEQGTQRFWWRPDTDQLLCVKNGTEPIKQAITDHIGSLIGLGNTAQSLAYEPYGGPPAIRGQQIGFGSKWWDEGSGLYDNRLRFYEWTSGRFTQPDPAGMIDGPNVYWFARSNPVSFVDPLGLNAINDGRGSVCNSVNEALRGYKIEHFDASGRKVGTTYVKPPGLFESSPHLVHYNTSGQQVGRTYTKAPGFLESRPHFEHFSRSGQREGTTYEKAPGFLESHPYLEHFDRSGKKQGTTYTKAPGLFESHSHFEHYDTRGQISGRSYIKPI